MIEIRSELQELMINMEEQILDLWNHHFDNQDVNQSNQNSFQLFRYKDDTLLSFNINQTSTIENTFSDLIDWWQIIDIPHKYSIKKHLYSE